MNKRVFTFFLMLCIPFSLYAEVNNTKDNNRSIKIMKKDINVTKEKNNLREEEVKKQIEREKKYAKEQKFYQGDEYDLKAVEINEKSLEHVPVIEPDYDFDITDVYRDDI